MVSELVAVQFPDLAECQVARFGSGDDHWIFSIGEDWLARFPQRLERVPWLRREIEILAIVDGHSLTKVPVYERVGQPSERFPYPFILYRKLPGVGADQSPVKNLSMLAKDLGSLLGKLHRIDTSLIPRTPTNWEGHSWETLRTELIDQADLARPYLPSELLTRAEPYLTGQIPAPKQNGPKRFIHDDICPDHVIVNPDTGALVGLIDFTDAMVGDIVLDFVGLIGLAGYGFIKEVTDNYDLDLGEDFQVQLEWLACTLTLRWLAKETLKNAGDIAKHLAWVEHAFNR